jgi:PEP-CTERM motif
MACTCVWSPIAAYGELIFTGTQVDQNGTGFGNVLTILSVQATSSEFGSVLWDGGSDVESDDATNQSQTRTVAQLLAAGIDETNLTLIFNVNEGGDTDPVLTLHDFHVVFQDASGAELFRETFDAGGGLDLASAGMGNGVSGWQFDVNFTANAAAAATFFGTLTNRIGMEIASDHAIENTKGSAESFFVAAPVPEPSALVQILLGLGLLAAWRSRRRVTFFR